MDTDDGWRFDSCGDGTPLPLRDRRRGRPPFDVPPPLTGDRAAAAPARLRLMTAGVAAKIGRQALRLGLKRAPIDPHLERP
jgi:hypothetical protein